jgi:hypothetical protein
MSHRRLADRLRGHAAAVTGALLATLALLLPPGALAQDAESEPLPAGGTALAAGRYTSGVVGPSIDFRVEDGWVVGPETEGPIFTLERADQPGAVLTVTRFDGDVFLDSCDPSSLVVVESTVSRLAKVIGGDPYLVPDPPTATQVDGYAGIQLDVATPAYDECDLPYLLVWALPIGDGGEFVQVANQQSRFIMLNVDGSVIVIAVESFPGVPFGGLLDAAMDLVDSMRITPGPPAASSSPAGAPGTSPAGPSPAPGASATPGPSPAPGASATPVSSPAPGASPAAVL